ncbi:hypothetical protein L1856_34425 [Streptomyces sp. Tue 6430]|nr:hypothetical protein [Streptomyces sp. Tue 6430]
MAADSVSAGRAGSAASARGGGRASPNFGRFRGPADAPDETPPEFGVSLSAEADVVVASTATVANFSVTRTGNRRDHSGATVDNP